MNRYASLGDGVVKHTTCYLGFDCSTVPVNVIGMADATQIARGAAYACAVRADGSVWCWGSNTNAQLGDGIMDHGNYPTWEGCQFNDCQSSPVRVLNMASPTQIAAGGGTVCALRSTGVVSCWGEGTYGGFGVPLGPNQPKFRYAPLGDVPGITDAARLYGAGDNFCAVRSMGRLTCWGGNSYGSLANGSYSKPTFNPKDVVW